MSANRLIRSRRNICINQTGNNNSVRINSRSQRQRPPQEDPQEDQHSDSSSTSTELQQDPRPGPRPDPRPDPPHQDYKQKQKDLKKLWESRTNYIDYSNLKRKRAPSVDVSLLMIDIVHARNLAKKTKVKKSTDLTHELKKFIEELNIQLINNLPLSPKNEKSSLVFHFLQGKTKELHANFLGVKVPIHKLLTCKFIKEIYKKSKSKIQFVYLLFLGLYVEFIRSGVFQNQVLVCDMSLIYNLNEFNSQNCNLGQDELKEGFLTMVGLQGKDANQDKFELVLGQTAEEVKVQKDSIKKVNNNRANDNCNHLENFQKNEILLFSEQKDQQ